MSSYAGLLESMMKAILSADTSSAGTLYRHREDFPPQAQLSVYIEGYRQRLLRIIQNKYPALHFYMGDKDFSNLVDAYIHLSPSRYINIDTYAIAFGEYALNNSADIFLQELATLENAACAIYYEPDTPPIDAAWLERQAAETIADIPFKLRPTVRLLAFTYPVSRYATSLAVRNTPIKPAPSSTYLALSLDGRQVLHLSLEKAEFLLLLLLEEGHTLGTAMTSEEFASVINPLTITDDFQRWLSHWIQEGFLGTP